MTSVDASPPGASRLSFLKRGRFWLAGPLTFIAAVLVMAGSAVWLPRGAAGIDNIVIPVVLFPGIWAVLFFYACLSRHITRAYVVLLLTCAVQIALVVWQMRYGEGL